MNEYTTPSSWSKWFGNSYNLAGIDYTMGGFAQLAAASAEKGSGEITAANYGVQAANARVQASELELRAVEEANALRKKYLAAVGNATYSAAARGADVSRGGNLRTTLERSSMELGDDMQTIDKNATRKAGHLRKQADIYETMGKAYAKASKYMSQAKLWQGIGSLGMGLAMFSAGGGFGGSKMATPYGDAIDPGQVASANNMVR
ncbi:MAG: hypothetical protein IJ881_00555 [Neisseriaceae bacterium]|nr:hypothetical protein [Neisseriaceae bacterium]